MHSIKHGHEITKKVTLLHIRAATENITKGKLLQSCSVRELSAMTIPGLLICDFLLYLLFTFVIWNFGTVDIRSLRKAAFIQKKKYIFKTPDF
jgi:hypothetical protein